MRSILTLAIIAGLATSAYAAPKAEKASATEASATAEGEGFTSTASDKPDANIETETAKISDVQAVDKAPRKWSLALESENAKAITNDSQAYSGDVEAYQAVKLGYKIQDNVSAQVVPEWTQRYGYGQAQGGVDNEAKTTFEDTSIRLTRSNVLTTGPVAWTVQGRYYAPLSDLSQAAGQIGQVRAYFIGGVELTKKLAFELTISPRYYIQKNKSFTDTDGLTGQSSKGKEVNNNDWRILNSAALKYALTDALAVETTLGVYSKKKHNSEMRHFQDYSTSLYYTVNSNLSLNAGVRATDGGLDVDNTGVELYNSHVSEYFGILTVSM